MKQEKNEQQIKGREALKTVNDNSSNQPSSREELDQRVKNEPDTERLRSERQSVIDADNKRRNKH